MHIRDLNLPPNSRVPMPPLVLFIISMQAIALLRGIHALDGRHFEYYQEVNASHKRTWLGWRQHFDDELRLRQNHRKNEEFDLLFVSILWHGFGVCACLSVGRKTTKFCGTVGSSARAVNEEGQSIG